MSTSSDQLPNASLASKLASKAVGTNPVRVTRFSTGMQHYVYDVEFANRAPVVVRMATPENKTAMESAFQLSNQLRPMGVPLPEILAADLEFEFPYLVLERFSGTDLMHCIRDLPEITQSRIAERVAQAQNIVAKRPSAGRYGYAECEQDAPYESWSSVLSASLAVARKGILAMGLFDSRYPDVIAALIESHRSELDLQPPTPFLHDTTTKNVIVAPNGEFSGIVDVDDLCYGDPRSVVALTLVSLANMGLPTGYVDSWMAAAKFTDDKLFRLYAALTAVYFMSEHGQEFNGNAVSSSETEREHLKKIADQLIEQSRP
jgi:aminoglycoside phosphotransferase (APT) family kinase protein